MSLDEGRTREGVRGEGSKVKFGEGGSIGDNVHGHGGGGGVIF
jgi:hypothetical protein